MVTPQILIDPQNNPPPPIVPPPPLTIMLFKKSWALLKLWDEPKIKLIHFVIK